MTIDQEIGVAELPKDLDDLNSHRPPGYPADKEQQAHFEVDVAQTEMRKGAGCRGPDDLVGIRSRRHSRGNAEHYQKRRHQKPAADPEDARQQAYPAP